MSGSALPGFEAASAVTPSASAPTVPHEVLAYDATIDAGWSIGDKPNGGYLLAMMGRAAVAAVSATEGPAHPHPVAATATYVSSPTPGPARIDVELLRRGRRMSQARTRLVRDGATCVEATFTVGRLDPAAEPWWNDGAAPTVPPFEACASTPADPPGGLALPIMERVDIRLDPAVLGFRAGRPSGAGELRGWLRFRDGFAPDALSLLYALDAFPPATFDLAETGWVPTLTLTAYVRALPAPGPLLVRQRAVLVEADMVDEICHVWDTRGRLVAQGTQLAGIRVGDAVPARRRDEPPGGTAP